MKRMHANHEISSYTSKMLMDIAALDQHAMIQITDLQARIIEVNDCLLSATGFSNSELIGQSASSLYHDRDRPMAFEIRDKILAGLAWTGEMRLMRKDGSVMWTQATIVPRRDSEGALVGAISIRSDISESKFADHHNDLTTTLHKLSDEVYMIDSDTFSFTYMNEAAMRRAKTNESGYDNWNLRKLFSDQEFDGFVQRIAPLLDGKTDQVHYDAVLFNVPYELRLQLYKAPAGKRIIVAILRDKTEQAEIERVRAELLATISHELRTPMTSIKGAMGLLLSNAAGELPEKARGMLSIAYRNADRLVMIINDILDIEKIAAGQMDFDMQVMPLVVVVEEAIAANEQFANRFDVSVSLIEADRDAAASFDFGRTLQVLTNLLSNAAKFSPPGGRVDVVMKRVKDRMRISVRDFGEGIDEAAQASIFERFTQAASGSRRGVASTGLGLNIARAIMDEQNGSIDFVSRLGEGSTFFVEFPLVKVGSIYDTDERDGDKQVEGA